MDRRKLRIILIAAAGIVILIIGIKAGTIYSKPTISSEALNQVSQTLYGTSYDNLDYAEQWYVVSRFPPGWSTREEENAEFKLWLTQPKQWFIKWVVIPVVMFLVLTASLVASRVILERIKPKSGSR